MASNLIRNACKSNIFRQNSTSILQKRPSSSDVSTNTTSRSNPLQVAVGVSLGIISGASILIAYNLKEIISSKQETSPEPMKPNIDPKLFDTIIAQERRQAALENAITNLREELNKTTINIKSTPHQVTSKIDVLELSKVIQANDLASARRHNSELDKQKKELTREYQIRVEGEVAKVETRYRPIALRLRELEAVIDEQKKIQEHEAPARILWISCQSLLDRIQSKPQEPLEGDPAFEVLRRLAADNDPVAISILDSIPSKVLKEGVQSQTSLMARFSKINEICKRVAMVDERGGGITRFLISYLQSLFIIDNVKVSEDEVFGGQLVDPSSWHTYDILARIRYCLDNQNLEQAIRYANQLRGQARFVARDWIRDARAHLEIRQALSIMSTHAKAIAVDAVNQQFVE